MLAVREHMNEALEHVERLINNTLTTAQQYTSLLKAKLALAEAERLVTTQLNEVERELLDEWGENGTTRQTVEGVTLYLRTERFFQRAPGVSTREICEQLAAQGFGDLVYPTYNSSALKKLFTEMGGPPPELSHLVSIVEVPTVGYRRE